MKPNTKDLLVLDIETVACYENIGAVPKALQKHWERKASYLRHKEDEDWKTMYTTRAGIYAEFGRVIVIGLGFYHKNQDEKITFRVKTLASHDEKKLLETFKALIETKYNQKTLQFCTHHGKEFDLPFLCRRMIVNSVTIPDSLQLSGKKPWEIQHIDLMELWKFGDRKSFVSLDLLSTIFNLPSSKDEIDGSMVTETYYQEKDGLKKIEEYCRKDVIATAQVYLKMNLLPLLEPEQIKIVEKLE